MLLVGISNRRARDTSAGAAPTNEESVCGSDGDESTGCCSKGSTWRDQEPSNAIAKAIAGHEDVDATELPPLYGSIDTDGLNAILRSAPGATVTFPHRGYEVTVSGQGEVKLVRLEER